MRYQKIRDKSIVAAIAVDELIERSKGNFADLPKWVRTEIYRGNIYVLNNMIFVRSDNALGTEKTRSEKGKGDYLIKNIANGWMIVMNGTNFRATYDRIEPKTTEINPL